MIAAWRSLAANLAVGVERGGDLNTAVEANFLGRRDAWRIARDAEQQRRPAASTERPRYDAREVVRRHLFVGPEMTLEGDRQGRQPDDASGRELTARGLVRRTLESRAPRVLLQPKPFLPILAR